MKNSRRFAFALMLLSTPANAEIKLDTIHLPPHFKIETFVSDLKGARSMTWGPNGILFVGTRDEGKVYAITPEKKVVTIASGLNSPNGVAVKDGALYVAEINRILKFDDIAAHINEHATFKVINDGYPSDKPHGWKFIAFGPDGDLYVPVGAPCNICAIHDPYAAITRIRDDGNHREIFARGVRNTVGFDWSPITHELWFTDNGRDWMGDDMPSDELNHAPRMGMHFGYPFCHQGDTLDPEFGKGKKCSDYTPPEWKMGPHVATLGMRFYTGTMFPSEYRNQIFVAEHGSWNRSVPIGYRIAVVKLTRDGKHAASLEVFADGWLQKDGKPWGRPVDVLVAADGALLVSDDYAGAVYRIHYEK